MLSFKKVYWVSVYRVWGPRVARRSQKWWKILGYWWFLSAPLVLLITFAHPKAHFSIGYVVSAVASAVVPILIGWAFLRLADVDLDKLEADVDQILSDKGE